MYHNRKEIWIKVKGTTSLDLEAMNYNIPFEKEILVPFPIIILECSVTSVMVFLSPYRFFALGYLLSQYVRTSLRFIPAPVLLDSLIRQHEEHLHN